MEMIHCEVTDYQPGTGTRYLLIHGIVPLHEARRLGCDEGALFLAWEGHGAWPFGPGVTADYVAEKFRIQQYMLDAEALAQFVRAKLEVPLQITVCEPGSWTICPGCGLPEYEAAKRYGCGCQRKKQLQQEAELQQERTDFMMDKAGEPSDYDEPEEKE